MSRFSVRNENGIALVMVLVISAIALAMLGVLVYMITAGTQSSGMMRRYTTTLEVAYGAQEPSRDYINSPDIFNTAIYTNFNFASSLACRTQKLRTTTSAANWAACANFANTTSTAINPANLTTYDWQLDLGGHTAYVKIVDTTEGNTGSSRLNLLTGSVTGAGTAITPPQVPYNYTMEVLSVNNANPNDVARVSYIYQY